jgi:ketosteroid isomerase-like protein
MKRATLVTSVALSVAMLAAGPAVAAERDNVMKTVHQWMESLNKGDMKTAVAACAEETAIVDEFPPYEWHGKGTCSKWAAALEVYNKEVGITFGITEAKEPRRVDITGNHAYVVLPVDYRFTQKGKDGAEIGALFTVALRKEQAAWRITGWAWSRP